MKTVLTDCSLANDKFKSPEFDAVSKILTEDDILRITGNTSA